MNNLPGGYCDDEWRPQLTHLINSDEKNSTDEQTLQAHFVFNQATVNYSFYNSYNGKLHLEKPGVKVRK